MTLKLNIGVIQLHYFGTFGYNRFHAQNMSETIQDDIRRGDVDPTSKYVASIVQKWDPQRNIDCKSGVSEKEVKDNHDSSGDERKQIDAEGDTGKVEDPDDPTCLREKILRSAKKGQKDVLGKICRVTKKNHNEAEHSNDSWKLTRFTYLNGESPVIRLRKTDSVSSYSTDDHIPGKHISRKKVHLSKSKSPTPKGVSSGKDGKGTPIKIIRSDVILKNTLSLDGKKIEQEIRIGSAIGDSSSDNKVGSGDVDSVDELDLSEWYYDVDDIFAEEDPDASSVYSYNSATVQSDDNTQNSLLKPSMLPNRKVFSWLSRSEEAVHCFQDDNRNFYTPGGLRRSASSFNSFSPSLLPRINRFGNKASMPHWRPQSIRDTRTTHVKIPRIQLDVSSWREQPSQNSRRHSDDEESELGQRMLNSPPHIRDMVELIRGDNGARKMSSETNSSPVK